jgi:type I restriction enzyme S subunit
VSFPVYAARKDSGVGWLGEVPSHWEVKSIKWLSPVLRGASPRPIDDPRYFDEDGEFAWVRIADASASDGVLRETTQRLSELGSSLSVKLGPGDLFVSIAGTVGKPCVAGIKCCIHDGFVYFPKLAIDPQWLFRLFESGACYAGLGKMGTQLNLNTDTIGSIRIGVPSQGELSSILRFVDIETDKIDALVQEQKRLIELLKEKRQAVMSQAVTKGLDPTVPMKDSGVEWLGLVPVHWQVTRLANLFSEVDERGRDDLPVLSVSIHDGVSDDELDESELERKVTRSDDRTKYKRVCPGDLTYNMMRAWQGGFGCVTVEGMVSPAYVVARPKTGLPTAYVERLLRTPHAIEEMRGRSRGVTDFRLRLYWEEFKDIRVALPPVEETEAVLSRLDDLDAKGNATTDAAEACIALLQERRAALISAAVTGKIDVRGLVPQPETAAP